ncbi:MAG: MarR family winged helix-turn-helix transcriptional regulator [Pseudomonadota bacterium]
MKLVDQVAESPGPRALLTTVRRIIRAVDVRSKRVAKETGLTIPQLVVLQAIAELGEVTTGRLSTQVSVSAATLVTILDKLEARGLIERYRSEVDRRIVHTRLTGAGAAALDTAPPLLDAAFVEAFVALPADRRATILDALSELADLFDGNPPNERPTSARTD